MIITQMSDSETLPKTNETLHRLRIRHNEGHEPDRGEGDDDKSYRPLRSGLSTLAEK